MVVAPAHLVVEVRAANGYQWHLAFDLDLTDIMEEAFEQAGLELRSGYDYRTARRSLNLLMLEWQNKGLNLWAVKAATQALTAGTGSYTLAGERLDIIEALLRTDAGDSDLQTDLTMRRVSISHYARQTNKLLQGKPIQYWVERTPTAITLNVWPVPDSVVTYNIYYYYMERIEDAGSVGTNNIDVPARYLPALTSGLAYNIAIKKKPEAAAGLKQIYDEHWNLAADSSREKAALRLVPGGYR